MNSGLRAVLGLGTLILAGTLGCSSAHTDAAAAGASGANAAGASSASGGENAGGSTSTATDGGRANGGRANGGGANGGGANGGAGATDACLEHSTPLRTEGTVLSFAIAPTFEGEPFQYGRENPLNGGGTLVPLNFRFYISQVQLLKKSGDPVSVDLVTSTGELEPYGVHLFNAEDDETRKWHVLAPADDYVGVDFGVGIKLGCNQQPPFTLDEPLSDASQMTWPHAGGFLFLRYEGRYTAADGSTVSPASIPSVVHMGGSITQELAPRVRALRSFTLSAANPLELALGISMDELFKGATADIDVSDVAIGFLSTPASVAGERLRRGLPGLNLFQFIVR